MVLKYDIGGVMWFTSKPFIGWCLGGCIPTHIINLFFLLDMDNLTGICTRMNFSLDIVFLFN